MRWNDVRRMVEVEGRMDAERFVAILEENLFPSIYESNISIGEVNFQQDNNPKHYSKLAGKSFDDRSIC